MEIKKRVYANNRMCVFLRDTFFLNRDINTGLYLDLL